MTDNDTRKYKLKTTATKTNTAVQESESTPAQNGCTTRPRIKKKNQANSYKSFIMPTTGFRIPSGTIGLVNDNNGTTIVLNPKCRTSTNELSYYISKILAAINPT